MFLESSILVLLAAVGGAYTRMFTALTRDFLPRRRVSLYRINSSENARGGRGCAAAVPVIAALSLVTAAPASPQTAPIKPLESPQQTRPQASTRSDATLEAPSLDPVLEEAKSLADSGAAKQAESSVREYIAAHPNSANAHFLLGYILFREVQQEAITASNETSANVPSQGAISANGSEVPPTTVSGSISRHTPGVANAGDKGSVSETTSRSGKVKASLAEFTEGAKYRTPSAYELKVVALDYVLLEDYMDADKWLTKMLEWAPNDSEGWYYLGRTKYNENRFDEAVHAFQQCLKLDPNNVKAEDNLGLSFAGLGRAGEAIAAYQTAIAWQKNAVSKNAGPFIDMADLLLDQNRSAEAISYLKQAIEISPRDFKAHELLGKAYARADQLPQAQRELEQAIALAPQNSNLPCMLAPIYRKQGNIEKAKAQIERCSALNSTHSSPQTPRQ